MADPKLKFGNDIWATKQKSLLAYNDEGGNFKSLPFQVDRISGGTYVGRNGLIQYAASNEPRIDFLNNTKGHLLLEPQRTNYLLRSDFFGSTFWSKISGGTGINPVVTDNYSISPDGTKNADRVVFNKGASDTSNDYSIIRQIVTNVGQGVSSVYMKSNTNDTYQIGIDETGTNEVISVTPQWQRFTYSETSNDRLQISLRGATTSDYADVSIWGAQMEAGTYATSYIPTTTSAVSRVENNVEYDHFPAYFINSSEGTFFVDFEYLYQTTSSSSTDALRDIMVLGTSTDLSEGISIDNYRGTFRVFVIQAAGNISLGGGSAQANTRYKLAVKYKTGDCKAYLNGILLGSSTGTINFATDLDGVFFSYNSSTRPYKNQKHVYNLQYFDEALSDAELAKLTTL